jgi:anaerobic magnesium-protoporphyrin IX monomethyl ester cyclase
VTADSELILLVNPRPSTWYTGMLSTMLPSPPLGLLYLAAHLKSLGYRVDVMDFVAKPYSKADIAHYIDTQEPFVIGITCPTEAVNAALRLCHFIKNLSPNTFTVMGGSHPTFDYQSLILNPAVDFIIRHEGEIAMAQLLRELRQPEPHLETVEGLCWKYRGEVVINEDRRFIDDLDALTFPARNLVELDRYSWPGSLATSRGCPHKCIFCAAGAMSGGKYRCRSAHNVSREIECMVNELGIRDFLFVDDTFTADKKRAAQICEMIIQSQLGITFTCESRVSSVDPEFLGLLKRAGCKRIQYGIESGSDEILKKIKKGITTEQIRRAVSWAREKDIYVKGSFILGHIWDTRETIQATFKLMRELNEKYGVEPYPAINIPFPGTEQYEQREYLGLEILTDNWDDYYFGNCIINIPNLSHIDLRNYFFEIGQFVTEANYRQKSPQ